MFLLLHLLFKRRKLFFIFVFLVILGVLLTKHFSNNGTLTQGYTVQVKDTKTLVNTLPDIEKSFETLKNNGYDVNKPLIYAYYFYDHDEKKLMSFSKILQKQGLYIGILDKSSNYTKNHLYLLYVTETTKHSPQTLFDQCNKLSDLAVKNHIEEFDGWDAGLTSLDGQNISKYQD